MNSRSNKKSSKEEKKQFSLLSGRGLFLGICLLFLLSGWMFVLGVLVGRGTAPVNFDIQALQKELLALKESVVKQERRAMESASDKVDFKTAFEFYEALKKKKKEEKITIPEKKARPKKQVSTRSEPKKNTSTPTASNIKPSVKKSLKPTNWGKIAVQVASTKSEAAADELVKKLIKMGYAGFRAVADIPNKGRWYRVRVGPYRTRGEAEKIRQELIKDKFDGIIVRN